MHRQILTNTTSSFLHNIRMLDFMTVSLLVCILFVQSPYYTKYEVLERFC